MNSDIDNKRYVSEGEFYYPGDDFRHFRPFHNNREEKKIHTLFAGVGQCVLGKIVPKVSSMARDRRPGDK